MTAGGATESVGDNVEFSVGTAGTEVTIYFNGGDSGDKTSADDTTTAKYADNYGAVKAFALRADQACTILSMNGNEFTDPITVVQNKSHSESLDTPIIFKMTIKTSTDNTNIKIRVRGR